MICNMYAKCEYCNLNRDCPMDLMGDGSAYCSYFRCSKEVCNMENCFDEEEFQGGDPW